MMQKQEKKKESVAIILDYLPHGYPHISLPSHRKTAIAQAIGKEYFSILELVPKKEVFLNPGDEVYIGEGKRDKIHHINGKIELDQLTGTAENELKFHILDIITSQEKRFVDFFNKSGPLSLRMHQLELIPGFGKKHMLEIIEAREEKPFENFADIKARVKLIPSPEDSIVKRILLELQGKEKYNLFVKQT